MNGIIGALNGINQANVRFEQAASNAMDYIPQQLSQMPHSVTASGDVFTPSKPANTAPPGDSLFSRMAQLSMASLGVMASVAIFKMFHRMFEQVLSILDPAPRG